MIAFNPRRQRLEEMVGYAAVYRDWSMRELGEALERDPSNLIPDSGIPKVDLARRLATALGWPLAELLDVLEHDVESAATRANQPGRSATEVDDLVQQGRHAEAIQTIQDALRDPRDRCGRAALLVRLADVYRRDGQFVEGRAVAGEAVSSLSSDRSNLVEPLRGEALCLRGLCGRDLIEGAVEDSDGLGRAALSDLESARIRLAIADESRIGAWPEAPTRRAALAFVAEGAALELDAMLHPDHAASALATLLDSLEEIVEIAACPDLDRLESHGWRCVFGFALAERALRDDQRLHQTLAILSNKADEIAARVESWALRERVLVLECRRRHEFQRWTGREEEWLLDREDVRVVIGCIGSSRRFRSIGLSILRQATLLDGLAEPGRRQDAERRPERGQAGRAQPARRDDGPPTDRQRPDARRPDARRPDARRPDGRKAAAAARLRA